MIRISALLVVLSVLALPSAVASASEDSMACGARNEMLGHLAGKYDEEPVAMGLATNGSLVEVLSNANGGSFTIVYTTPEGLTCMMAAGSNWEMIRELADTSA